MGSLSNLYISASYTSLVHLGNDGPITALAPGQFVALQDGLGNSLKIELNNNGDVNIGGILSASNIPTDIATQAELNAYTQSTNIRLNNIESTTASLNISVTNLNASSASQQVSINELNVFTASQSTASINTSITNLNAFTSSQLSINSGYNTFTSSQISFNNSATASIVALQNFSSSLDANFVTEAELAAATASLINQINTKLNTSSFNSYTQSNDQRVNSLESNSASVNISISNLNSTTSSFATSIANLNSNSASVNTSISALNTFTASQSTASIVTSINNLNTFSASALVSISNINSTTASLNTSVSNLNTFTGSQLIINSGYNTFTSSANQRLSSLETNSASVNISISALNTFTASQSTASIVTSITELNTFSASAKISINALNTNSASVNTSISNLNSFTQSQEGVNSVLAGEIDSLQAKTGSYATTGSNNFIGNQNITGNITAFSASFTYLQTIYESSSIIYSSGSNQFGDELSDVQTLSGSVKVQGSLTVNGTPVLTSSVDISGLVTTASFNAYTQSNNQRVSSLESNSASVNVSISNINTTTASLNTSVSALNTFTASQSTASLVTSINNLNTFSASALVSISNLNTNSASVNTSITNLNASSASQQISINALNVFTASQSTASLVTSITNLNTFSASALVSISNINSTTASLNTSVANINTFTQSANQRIGSLESATSSYVTETESGSFLVTASFDNGTRNLTFTKGDTTTFAVNIPDASGSILPNGVVSGSQQIIDLGFLQTASFNSYTQSNDIRVSSLESATASLYTSVANINTFTQSANISINALNAATSSYVTSAITASSLITASFDSGTRNLTFTKGDTTTFNVNIPDVSGSTINTASFATTGSNSFTGSQSISGSITLTGSLNVVANGVSSIANNTGLTSIELTTNVGIKHNNSGQVEIFSPSGQAGIKLSPGGVGGSGKSFINFDTLGGLNHDIISIEGATTNTSASLQIKQANQDLLIAEYGPLKLSRFYNKVDISGSLSITGSLSASLNQGYVWVGNGSNRTVLLSTSSFATDISGLTTTASFNAYTQSNDSRVSSLEVATASLFTSIDNLNTFSASTLVSISNINTTTASLLIETQNLELFSASALISISNLNGKTGSYATTGSNVFTGSQTFADSGSNSMTLHSISGSLGYTNSNIDSFFNVSASFISGNPNQRLGGNLLLKTLANATGSLVLSGSSNLVMSMPTVTQDFRAQLTTQNLAFALPQVSASMAFPITIGNNIIQSSPSFRGAVSSSAWNISNNFFLSQVSLGQSVPQNFEKAIAGVNLSSNIVNGNIAAIANSASLNTAFSITNSNINQTLTINAISSSVQIGNSNMGGLSATINNRASHSVAPGTNNFLILSSVLTAGQTTVINADGASATNVSPGLVADFIGGSASTIQLGAPGVSSNSNQLRNTIVFGQNLTVTGSNSAAAPATQGGAFLGRWNSATPNQNDSSYVVLVVGTGTSNATRKTGFLIDSGSNTFVEGSLNVSGSSSVNGTQRITGSLIVSGAAGIEVRFPSFDATDGRIKNSLSFTGSVSASTDMGILTPTQFAFNQNAIGDGNTGAQFVIETNKGSGFTELKLNARYTGSANAQIGIRNAAGVRTATIDADATTVNGSLTIQSGSSFFANGNKQFNVGAFQSNINQSGSANVSQSMNFETTDISEGVSMVSNSRITLANSGTYNIQFSAQILADTGADNVWIWLMKNGTNVPATAGHVVLANNEELIAAWNYVVNAAANDYYELVWQSSDGDAILLAEPVSGNIPSVPSTILTVTQVR